jgi:hypothetical protein
MLGGVRELASATAMARPQRLNVKPCQCVRYRAINHRARHHDNAHHSDNRHYSHSRSDDRGGRLPERCHHRHSPLATVDVRSRRAPQHVDCRFNCRASVGCAELSVYIVSLYDLQTHVPL